PERVRVGGDHDTAVLGAIVHGELHQGGGAVAGVQVGDGAGAFGAGARVERPHVVPHGDGFDGGVRAVGQQHERARHEAVAPARPRRGPGGFVVTAAVVAGLVPVGADRSGGGLGAAVLAAHDVEGPVAFLVPADAGDQADEVFRDALGDGMRLVAVLPVFLDLIADEQVEEEPAGVGGHLVPGVLGAFDDAVFGVREPLPRVVPQFFGAFPQADGVVFDPGDEVGARVPDAGADVFQPLADRVQESATGVLVGRGRPAASTPVGTMVPSSEPVPSAGAFSGGESGVPGWPAPSPDPSGVTPPPPLGVVPSPSG